MNKLYRRCKVFILTEFKSCPFDEIAIYSLAYQFALSEQTAKRIYDFVLKGGIKKTADLEEAF